MMTTTNRTRSITRIAAYGKRGRVGGTTTLVVT